MKIGDTVGWRRGSGLATKEVLDILPQRTQIESKEKFITRNGRSDNPAVIIQSAKGSHVIKLTHELQVIRGGENV